MTQQHPITPAPELVQQWAQIQAAEQAVVDHWQHIATRAAQWGADQELDACCEWLAEDHPYVSDNLRAARRPKPLSLSRVALLQLDVLSADLGMNGAPVDFSQIRRALKRLQELEEQK